MSREAAKWSKGYLDCLSSWHSEDEPALYEVVIHDVVAFRLCAHCAPEAEQGIREGSMIWRGVYQSAQTATLRSVGG